MTKETVSGVEATVPGGPRGHLFARVLPRVQVRNFVAVDEMRDVTRRDAPMRDEGRENGALNAYEKLGPRARNVVPVLNVVVSTVRRCTSWSVQQEACCPGLD